MSEFEDGQSKSNFLENNNEGGGLEDLSFIEGVTREEVFFCLDAIMRNVDFKNADFLIKKYNLSEEVVLGAAKKALESLVFSFDKAMELIARYNLPEDVVSEVVRNSLLKIINGFDWRVLKGLKSIVDKFAIVDQLLKETEVRVAIKKKFLDMISDPNAVHMNVNIISEFATVVDPCKEICLSDEVKKSAIVKSKENLSGKLNWHYEDLTSFIKLFGISETDLREKHIADLVEILGDQASLGGLDRYVEAFFLTDLTLKSEEVKVAAVNSLKVSFSNKYWYTEGLDLIKKIGLSPEEVKGPAKVAIHGLLWDSVDIALTKTFLQTFSEYLSREDYVEDLENFFLRMLENYADIRYLKYIYSEFSLPESFVKSGKVLLAASKRIVDEVARNSGTEFILQAKDWFGFDDMAIFNFLKAEKTFSTIIERFGTNDLSSLGKFIKDNSDFVGWLRKNKEECFLNEADLLNNSGFDLKELNTLKKAGFDLAKLDEKDNERYYQEAFSLIKDSRNLDWEDRENISGPFENGAQKFGYKKMFEYIKRKGLTHHDALHNFNKVLALLGASEIKPAQFYGQILDQVRMDDSQYDTGTAHHELNSLVSIINLDVQEAVAKASKYKDIGKLQALVADLGSPEQVFASWRSLKKYKEVCLLLGRTEILDKLKELKESGKMELYRFIETLAFHPNISMDKVFQFWQNPGTFLEIKDDHDKANVHDKKKPSNYTHIPNLDLTAENLRDAQVEGKLDELQAFRPLEITYELPRNGEVGAVIESEKNTIILVQEALGSFKDKIPCKAKDPKKLFKELNNLFRSKNLNLKDYLEGKIVLDSETEAQILALLEDKKTGYGRVPQVEVARYRAKINLKSDPDGVIAGNDTACCMPFGSGKNNVYTFNPACSLFAIQQERSDGTWRTVAQSVLTKDKDIKRNVAEVLELMSSPQKPRLDTVLPEDILVMGESILACDNVELTPNVKGHELAEAQIEMIYKDFMAEYLARYAKLDNLSNSQVVIGKGYSDSLTHLPQIENTFVPSAPVAYSDKTHDKVFQLVPKLAEGVQRQVVEHKKPGEEKELVTSQKGISFLTFEDAISVAYLEGKIYADNTSLIQYLHNMENGLIAKDIKNTTESRANMSFKHSGEDGKIHGYMVAYEGRLEEGKYMGEPVIYVSDIASDKKNHGTGKALMLALLEQYRKNYVNKGNFLPIYAQARESTSYAIITKKLQEYGALVGLELELEEVGNYKVENDTMHQIIIRVKR